MGKRQPQQGPGREKLGQSMVAEFRTVTPSKRGSLAVSCPSVWRQAVTRHPFSFARVAAWALGTLALSKNGIWWSGLRMSRLFPATVLAGWEIEGPDGRGGGAEAGSVG